MDGFHIHQVLSLLLVILLWVPSGLCKGKSNGGSNNNNSQPSGDVQGVLPKQCSGGQNAWWQALEFNQSDPCQVHQMLLNQGTATACCAFSSKFPIVPCGPCNPQTYNIATACLACTEIPSDVIPDEDAIKQAKSMPNFLSWTSHGGGGNVSLPAPFSDIPWVKTNISTDGFFNVSEAILLAQKNPSNTTSSPSSTSSSSSSALPASQTSPTGTSSTPSTSASSSSSSNAAAIAGGTVGACVFLVLLTIGFMIYRRRRRAKMAPSAQFLAAARPMEAYNFSPQLRWGSDDPRPPSPAWTETSHEKVQTTAQFQRDYEAGTYYAI